MGHRAQQSIVSYRLSTPVQGLDVVIWCETPDDVWVTREDHLLLLIYCGVNTVRVLRGDAWWCVVMRGDAWCVVSDVLRDALHAMLACANVYDVTLWCGGCMYTLLWMTRAYWSYLECRPMLAYFLRCSASTTRHAHHHTTPLLTSLLLPTPCRLENIYEIKNILNRQVSITVWYNQYLYYLQFSSVTSWQGNLFCSPSLPSLPALPLCSPSLLSLSALPLCSPSLLSLAARPLCSLTYFKGSSITPLLPFPNVKTLLLCNLYDHNLKVCMHFPFPIIFFLPLPPFFSSLSSKLIHEQ